MFMCNSYWKVKVFVISLYFLKLRFELQFCLVPQFKFNSNWGKLIKEFNSQFNSERHNPDRHELWLKLGSTIRDSSLYCAVLSIYLAYRETVHTFWMPEEVGWQNGTPHTLRQHTQTPRHQSSLQPEGVLRTNVSKWGSPCGSFQTNIIQLYLNTHNEWWMMV